MPKKLLLNNTQINQELASLNTWSLEHNKISKLYKFNNFLASLDFIIELAPNFERLNHHPDIEISYNKVKLSLTSHDMGDRLTNLDFKVARIIEDKYKSK